MGFGQAVSSGFSNYAAFSGRSSRSAYWYWFLFGVLVSIGTTVVDAAVGSAGLFNIGASLVLLLPGLAVGVRRLHDIGKSGWNLLWSLIPILGTLYVIYLLIRPSDDGRNRYGDVPIEGRTPLAGHA